MIGGLAGALEKVGGHHGVRQQVDSFPRDSQAAYQILGHAWRDRDVIGRESIQPAQFTNAQPSPDGIPDPLAQSVYERIAHSEIQTGIRPRPAECRGREGIVPELASHEPLRAVRTEIGLELALSADGPQLAHLDRGVQSVQIRPVGAPHEVMDRYAGAGKPVDGVDEHPLDAAVDSALESLIIGYEHAQVEANAARTVAVHPVRVTTVVKRK